jgi:hypothetical protein
MEQIDVKAAYADKHQYSLIELKRKLGITNDNPIVFIFAHIFSDTPRGANDKILFIDFYKWLYETIKYVKDLKDINWVVKPHPSVQA